MRKLEFFLLIISLFFGNIALSYAKTASSVAKIPPKTIAEFNSINPIAGEFKDDDYWNLAWHARAADYGDRESQFILAQAYENGDNTPINPRKAFVFYKKAAEQGHLESCMRLGKIYLENKWVQKDLDKSLFWLTQAAEQGYIPAQLKLASLYETSEKKDYVSSYYWLAKATTQLFPNTLDLEQKAPHLVQLSEHMTPEEYEAVLERLD